MIKIVSSQCPAYTAVLSQNQLTCFINDHSVAIITVRNEKEARAILDHWFVKRGLVQDSQRFYDLHLSFPSIKMDQLYYYSEDRKTICYQGRVIAREL